MQELEAKISQKNEKKRKQNAYRSRKRLQEKTVNRAEQVSTNLQFDSLSISSTGWMGRRFDGRENLQMKKRWADRTIEADMVDFQRVPFQEKYCLPCLPYCLRYADQYKFEITARNGYQGLRRSSNMQEVDVRVLYATFTATVAGGSGIVLVINYTLHTCPWRGP